MFEKEAEEYARPISRDKADFFRGAVEKAYITGAEFGYNKAKEDADKMKSQFLELCNLKDMRIEKLEKATEIYQKIIVCL